MPLTLDPTRLALLSLAAIAFIAVPATANWLIERRRKPTPQRDRIRLLDPEELRDVFVPKHVATQLEACCGRCGHIEHYPDWDALPIHCPNCTSPSGYPQTWRSVSTVVKARSA